ncbi:MAG: tungsten formylmethanofuran dehydrogenase [Bacteroidia bacterium]|nr:tungsten formylmethanofuran dehydrogenase [Bacteroidia bacterium]
MENSVFLKAFKLMSTARAMADIYDANRNITKYVHSTSKGHEAVQLALAFQLKSYDFVSPYYRDESMLLGMGLTPYELMLQLLAKADDPFSGGRTYYAHPSLRREGIPVMPHQSSATGMQAIPATGMAHGVAYKESQGLNNPNEKPVVVCSLGDGSVTEGEIAEALQMAILKKLPIIFFVQDNNWGISASGEEMRAMDAYEYAAGFKGLERRRVDGSDFQASFDIVKESLNYVRIHRAPLLICAKVPLLGHHTSGVRKEWYRTEEDMAKHTANDPFEKLKYHILNNNIATEQELETLTTEANTYVASQFNDAVNAPEPSLDTLENHVFAPSQAAEEVGNRTPEGKEPSVMVDAALHAVDEIMRKHKEAIFYGQDVGARLGGVFREAATLASKYGDDRVFNTPIQEAYIVGSTVGMSAVGVKPIVEIQFADYVWSGVNQLVCEITKSSYLTMGKFPVSCVIRIPIGAYGGGGPYHSGSIESTLLTLKGIKIAYPSNAADMKGLMKAAYYDGNPCIILEHKGLYWSKNPGTELARCIEPDEDYILPFGKANIVLQASDDAIENGESCTIITWGMGVYWSLTAAKQFAGRVEIVDLRSLQPLDEETIMASVIKHGKCLIVTEEPLLNSFAESLAARIMQQCFTKLDAPVMTIGSKNLPAVPLNMGLEAEMLPNANKVADKLNELLNY